MHDLRIAFRELRRSPIVTAVAVLSLALGIGANTAIFSLVNSLLVRPIPVDRPEQLVVVSDTRATSFVETWTYGIFRQIQDRAQGFDGACASWIERLNLAPRGGEKDPIDAMWVSGDYFATLGVPALLGRTLKPEDDVAGGGRDGAVAVVSYDFWQRRLGGAASAIGTPVVIERVPFTIVGVAPPGFFGTEVGRTFDVAMPFNDEPLIRGKDSRISLDRGFYGLTVLLRLKPGQSTDAATTLLRGVQPQIRAAAVPASLPPDFRKDFLKDPFTVIPAATGTSGLRGRYQRPLLVILVVVALVLFIACANIANLQLARGIARRHELSVRLALGATRTRLARGPLLESLLMASAGAALGMAFAVWSSRLIVAQLTTWTTRIYLDLAIDWRVLAFTALVTVATAIVFGVLPAFRTSAVAPIDAIKDQGRGSADGRSRLSGGLVVAQVALSVVIVAAAGLFVRTFENLAKVPLGFESGRVLVVSVNLSRANVTPADRVALLDRLAREAGAVPGATRAAASTVTPIGGFGLVDMVHVDGMAPSTTGPGVNGRLAPRTAYVNFVSPGWFATYGTPIVAGRDFSDADVKEAPPVLVVNESFVRKYLGGRSPVGATVAFERGRGAPVLKTIVGVVKNAAYGSVRAADEPVEYAPLAQSDFPVPPTLESAISVRAATGSPMLLARSIAAAFRAVNPDLVVGFRPLTEQVAASLTQERLVAALAGFFGALALLLAGLGLYGITAYGVARRRTEIGIRMALGSSGSRVVGLVVSRAAWLVALGVAIGVGISAWASRFVATLLFGLDARDPVTFAGAGATLVAVALAAAWLPAYRASRLDPASVLREN